MADTSATAKISVEAKALELPLLHGTLGPDVIDIAKLYGQSNVFTYDPGFHSHCGLQIGHHVY